MFPGAASSSRIEKRNLTHEALYDVMKIKDVPDMSFHHHTCSQSVAPPDYKREL